MKKQQFYFLIFISLIVIATFVGCEQEETYNEPNNNETYLSLPSDVNFDALTESDMDIISQTFHRLDIAENEDGLFEIKQSGAKDINVSEELFNYFQQLIADYNQRIASGVYYSRNKLQTRQEYPGGNTSNDCVAKSIVYATGQNYDTVNSWIVSQYGNKGVPASKFYDVMEHFCDGDPVLLSDFEDIEIEGKDRENNKYVIVVNNTHAANVYSKNSTGIIYGNGKDDQSKGFCLPSDVTHVYKVE